MITVIGVRFRTAGKIYYFSPAGMEIKIGDHVIVETARGIEYGYVVLGNRDVDDGKVVPPLKAVIRMATPEDEAVERRNKEKEKEAFRICQEKIKKHNLEMKLIDAEYTFDNNKVLFYFTADGRIDFRELVKDLASVFKTRIELRQVGVRDETKIMGGMGICGRTLCCHSYLSEFIPVSIRMAKEQNLSLNPSKISGVCGRLMCCLKNEEETYEELNSKLPGIGDFVTAKDGLKGEVHSVNVLRQLVKVVVTIDKDEKEIREYKAEELTFRPRKKKGKGGERQSAREEAELQELEELERREGRTKDERPERSERPERPDRGGRNHSSDRGDRAGRPERGGAVKADRGSRHDRPRGEKNSRPERGGRPERAEKGGRPPRPERSDGAVRRERREQNGRNQQRERGEKPQLEAGGAGASEG